MRNFCGSFEKRFFRVREKGSNKSTKVSSGHWRYNRKTTVKWCKKYQHQQKYVVLVKCVEDVVRRKEYSFGNWETRSGWTEKVTGHKNIQSLIKDYDEANEDEQRQLSYAISGRNNFNPQPTVVREAHDQQEPLASSAQFLQPPRARMPIATDFDAQFFSVWIKPNSHIA